MINYLLILFFWFSSALAEACKPQIVETLKKNAPLIDCIVVNEKPLTVAAIQVFPTRDLEPADLTISIFVGAHLFGPHTKADKVKTRLGEVMVPFMFNGEIVPRVLYEDIDKDGKKEIVFVSVILPKALQVHIYSWDAKERELVAEGRSMRHDESVEYMAGSYLPTTLYEFPKLNLKEKTLLVPNEKYSENRSILKYRVYELEGPLYVDKMKFVEGIKK